MVMTELFAFILRLLQLLPLQADGLRQTIDLRLKVRLLQLVKCILRLRVTMSVSQQPGCCWFDFVALQDVVVKLQKLNLHEFKVER